MLRKSLFFLWLAWRVLVCGLARSCFFLVVGLACCRPRVRIPIFSCARWVQWTDAALRLRFGGSVWRRCGARLVFNAAPNCRCCTLSPVDRRWAACGLGGGVFGDVVGARLFF